MATQAQSPNIYLLVPIALMAALLGTAVIRGPSLVSEAGAGAAIIVAAPLILATYSLMVWPLPDAAPSTSPLVHFWRSSTWWW